VEKGLQTQITQNAESISAEATRATKEESALSSKITQTADSITAEVTRATKEEEALSTKVSQTAHSIKLTVNNGSTSSGISIQLTDANGNEIGTDSANIEMTGLVSFSDLSTSGKTTINGSNITTGTIDANVVNVKNVVAASVAAEDITGTTISGKTLESSSSVYKVVVSEGRLRFYYNDTLKGTISSFLNYAGTNYESTISGIKIDNDLYIGSQLMIGGTAISNYTLYAKGDARITGTIYGGSSAYPVVLGKYTGGSMTIYVLSNVLQIYQGGTVYNVDVSSSDIRLKENIDDTKLTSLDIVNRMQLREFDWKESGKHQDIGFIADELEELDECFVVGGGYADEEQTIMDVKSIDTLYLCAHLAKAIQEQQTQIEELKRQLLK
jgi:hypothetical protein